MVYRLPADFMAIYIFPRFAIFYCKVFYFEVLDNFHVKLIVHNCSEFPFSLPHLEVRNSVGRLENAVRP